MRNRATTWVLAALAITLAVAAPDATAQAKETRLLYDPALWQRKAFNMAGEPDSELAGFSVSKDEIAVGPSITGEMSARLEYLKRLPLTSGTILGRYRTEETLPRQAMVRIQFYAGDRSLATRTYALGATKDWGEFAIPVFRPPAEADSISVGFGLSERTDGRVFFSDLRVSDRYEPPNVSDRPALTRPKPPREFARSAAVRIERAGAEGAWWLVHPDGKPFFSLASAMRRPTGEGAESGERGQFAEMRKLGFNSTVGDLRRWAAFNEQQIAAGQPTAVQFVTVATRVGTEYGTLVNAAGNNPGSSQAQAAARGGFNHAFPDPFDPRWRESLRSRVRETAEIVRGKPYFGGWFADNERAHKDIHRYVWSEHCAAEFRKFLEGKYRTIEALNKAWGSAFASFDALMQEKPDPVVRKGAMYEDFRLFSREIIRQFNQTVLSTIREEDPGHLVLSNRFMIGEIRDVLDNLDLYRDFDAIAVNIYPSNLAPGLDPSERQFIEAVHQRTGKPILIGEWSVPALDSGLYDNPARLDWSYPQAMETQTQRARQAARILADLYNMPFVIGAHWFTWSDIDTSARQANRGLFKANGEPWVELQESLRRVTLEIEQRGN